MSVRVTVVGAGLAGCEAAAALARLGISVELLEMKPERFSPAHRLAGPAELVCSNSLKSDDPATAQGLLKNELRALGSVIMQAAARCRVPAGGALAVDREKLSGEVARLLAEQAKIKFIPGRPVEEPPPGEVILATGPLTDAALAGWLEKQLGQGVRLFFYDALAPIVEAESIDFGKVFLGSRYGKGSADYVNCPLDREQYRALVRALVEAPKAPVHEFEPDHFFEGCLPVEEMARRGEDTLAFGPLKPVGFGREAYAVVQLRAENCERTAYNLVGFQTRLTQPAQRQVFRMIPGLEKARFLRYGAMHRNLYLDAPRVLDDFLGLKTLPRVHLCGQMVGVEGYLESAALGLLCALAVGSRLRGRHFSPPPPSCALGALWRHVRRPAEGAFEPMNINFGLFPALEAPSRPKRRELLLGRARKDFDSWLKTLDLPLVPRCT
jgi:methylenetetrahydrofolate--tRNA-(uracil-5-)-methyltransferase